MKQNQNFNKSLLITVGLLLALSSCGKSKDLKSSPPTNVAPTAEPVKNTEATPAKTPAKTPLKKPKPAKGRAQPIDPADDASFDDPSSDDEMDGPNDLIPRRNESPINNRAANENPDAEIEVLPPLPSPHQNPGEDSSVLNPPLSPVSRADRAYQVNFVNSAAVKTGGKSQDLFYTGAGRDGLLSEFKSYMTKVSPEQQTMNANLAKAVVTAKLSRRTSSGVIAINMIFNEFGKTKTYRLTGSTEGNITKLNLSPSGTNGAMEFQGGFLKCLDADGGCEMAYAKMKFAKGYVRVIFRNSLADMHFQYTDENQSNPGFSLWMKYILNSSRSEQVAQTFDTMQLSSFEVVNGRAGMGALLTTHDREMLGLSIPLVVSGVNSDVDAPVAKLNDLASNYDLAPQASAYSQNLSKALGAVKLIKNNGQGEIKMTFAFGEATIWMVVKRVQKETLPISEIRKFEIGVKNF